jgi:hypothetical protein
MTAGRWTPSIASPGRARKTRVIFEFQRELANGEWKALGLARTAADDFDIVTAVRALQATWKGSLPEGAYRTRSPEGDSRWRYGRVDRSGNFALMDD